MPRIKIEIEVPDNDCDMCEKSYIFNAGFGKTCMAFKNTPLKIVNDKYQRCHECIDAEVKDED